MSTTGAPKGYHSVTPALVCRDAAAAIEFYQKAFGATVVTRMDGPDGKVVHAEIKIGDSIVMLGEESPAWGTKSPLTTGAPTGSLHIYVPDADKAFQKALDAGATIRYPLEDAFWGDRYGKVADPFGHEWGLATHVRDLSDAEVQKAAEEWMAKQAQSANA